MSNEDIKVGDEVVINNTCLLTSWHGFKMKVVRFNSSSVILLPITSEGKEKLRYRTYATISVHRTSVSLSKKYTNEERVIRKIKELNARFIRLQQMKGTNNAMYLLR